MHSCKKEKTFRLEPIKEKSKADNHLIILQQLE